jgi:hypothetical protein
MKKKKKKKKKRKKGRDVLFEPFFLRKIKLLKQKPRNRHSSAPLSSDEMRSNGKLHTLL